MSKFQVSILSHNRRLMSIVPEAPHFKKIDLSKLDLDSELRNYLWCENSAYFSDEVLGDHEYLGLLTGSWDKKYQSPYTLDKFLEWPGIKRLLDGEDIVVCSVLGQTMAGSALIFEDEDLVLFRKYVEGIGLRFKTDWSLSRECPFSSQMVMSRDKFIETKEFMEKHLKGLMAAMSDSPNIHKHRYLAYFGELLSMMWFDSKDWVYVPTQTQVRKHWYQRSVKNQSIAERLG